MTRKTGGDDDNPKRGPDARSDGSPDRGTGESSPELPPETIDAAVRLTRRARRAVDGNEAAAYREDRDERLAKHGFTARIREEDDTLVLYPAEWIEDGTVQLDRVDDPDRAVERTLTGTGDDSDWPAVEAANAEVVSAVEAAHGPVHAANVRAFADFMSNHYARRIETASQTEVREFLTEYYPRNAWPDADQRAVVERSLRVAFETVGVEPPL